MTSGSPVAEPARDGRRDVRIQTVDGDPALETTKTKARNSPMTVGYLADCFDLLNVRDLDLITQAGERVDRLVVGVYSDDFAQRVLGRRPVVPEQERSALVTHVRGVHQVVVHAGDATPDGVDRVFVAADRSETAGAGPVEVLELRRQSASPQLRAALQPDDEAAVA